MGLINGGLTYKKYRVADEVPKNFKETVVNQLPKYVFRDINPKTNPEVSVGWVHPFNALDTRLSLEKVLFGKYIILGLRKDKKSIPGLLLKATLTDAARAQMKERHGRKLSREEMASLKEVVKEKLLSSVSPTTALFEAVWNYETQDVYFSSQALKPSIEFAELFEETFGLALEEVNLVQRAEAYIEREGLGIELEQLDAANFA